MTSVLERLYAWGLSLDRRLTRVEHFPVPVVSVGNIALGGRGKTPFVIMLARELRAAGYSPVVLTRGYRRRSHAPVVVIEPERHTADEAGDEALEIAWLAGVPVLVGAERALNARAWLSEMTGRERPGDEPERTLFLLDDGFQHWKIARDFDLVLTDPRDREDRLLPTGRLREPWSALERAHLVLERGRDFEKKSRIPHGPTRPSLALTTRAPDPGYMPSLADLAGVPLKAVALIDHAAAGVILRRLEREDPGVPLLMGAKEAVKLLPPAALQTFFSNGYLGAAASPLGRDVHYVACDLVLKDSARLHQVLRSHLATRPEGTSL